MRRNGIREQLLKTLEAKQSDAAAWQWASLGETMNKILQLRMKAVKVSKFLESGRNLPHLRTYSERLARLRDRLYCASEDYLRARLTGPWSVDLPDQDPRFEFISRFTIAAVHSGIPVVCQSVQGEKVHIVHALYLDRLDHADWVIFAQIGQEVVGKYGLHVEWAGTQGRPFEWIVRGAYTPIDRLRLRHQLNNEIDAYCLSIHDEVSGNC